MTIPEFQHIVTEYFRENGRSFPWRETQNPYEITVSELMLQQTQTGRVIPKYEAFLKALPTWEALAETDTATLLGLWQGLGYNRRALNLKRMAEIVTNECLPQTEKELLALPGIGPYTAGAIMAFAFDKPVVMIETNIRRAFLYHFFPDENDINDKDLFPLIEQSLVKEDPRSWYYALMDYGAYLGRTFPNANKRSKHYMKQSTFQGSFRQVRGEVVRQITAHGTRTMTELVQSTDYDPIRLQEAIEALSRDGFLTQEGDSIKIAS
jgi:A/G-specific adenine glycosylase